MGIEYGVKLQINHTGGWSHFYIHKIYQVYRIHRKKKLSTKSKI